MSQCIPSKTVIKRNMKKENGKKEKELFTSGRVNVCPKPKT
jgi:hypothetical protein